MKNMEHPEFFLLREIQDVRQKYADLPELAELEERARRIINENSIMMIQTAMLYFLLGRPGDLYPDTREKLKGLLQNGIRRLDDTPSSGV